MLESIVYAVLVALILVGVIALAYFLALMLLTPNGKGRLVVIIPADAEDDDIARLMYSAHLRLWLLGGCCRGEVLAVDTGMSSEKLALCRSMCRECDNMYICRPQELAKMLTEEKPLHDDK